MGQTRGQSSDLGVENGHSMSRTVDKDKQSVRDFTVGFQSVCRSKGDNRRVTWPAVRDADLVDVQSRSRHEETEVSVFHMFRFF